jgi:hypothetical protein
MAHLPTPPRPWLEETDPPPPFVFGRGKGVRFENDLRALASRVERATFHFKTRLSDFWHQRRLTFAILIFYKLRLILRFTAWQITCRWGHDCFGGQPVPPMRCRVGLHGLTD